MTEYGKELKITCDRLEVEKENHGGKKAREGSLYEYRLLTCP